MRGARCCCRWRFGAAFGLTIIVASPSAFAASSARTASSSLTTSSIEAGRSAGIFAMQRSTSDASRSGVSGRCSSTFGTGSLTCFIATVRKLSPG